MEQVIERCSGFFAVVQGAGPMIFVPVVMLVTGVCLGIGLMKATKAAITVGVGFISVQLALNLVWNTLGPVANTVVERFGL